MTVLFPMKRIVHALLLFLSYNKIDVPLITVDCHIVRLERKGDIQIERQKQRSDTMVLFVPSLRGLGRC